MTKVDYAVVGAGAVGTSCALLLANKGFSVALIGAINTKITVNPSYALNRTSEIVLSKAGIWQHTNPSAYKSMEVSDIASSVKVNLSDNSRDNLGHIITYNDLSNACVTELNACANVAWYQQNLSSLNYEDDYWDIGLSNDTHIDASVVIAADGKNSTICKLLSIPRKITDTGDMSIVAQITTKKPHNACARQWFYNRGIIAFLPLKNENSVSIVWSADKSYGNDLLKMSTSSFINKLEKKTLLELGSLELTTKLNSFYVSQHNLSNYFQKGVVFVGDAAHSVHPLAGQGMNMGFHDILVLVSELVTEKEKNKHLSSVPLFNYQQKRQLDNYGYTLAMSGIQHSFRSSNKVLQYARSFAMRRIQRSYYLQNKIIQMALYGRLSKLKETI